jgi:putative transposase
MVTAGTYDKAHLFADGPRLEMLHDELLSVAAACGWQLQAWAAFTNHYHFVGITEGSAESLTEMTRRLHSVTAIELNRIDGQPGRKVWHNYWDKHLTYQRSYFARLNYVHNNAAKHGLVERATAYPYCSAAWFQRTAPPTFVKSIQSFRTDRLDVPDDF